MKRIREEQKSKLWAYYEKEVGKAIESGQPIPAEEFWKQIREEREQRRQEKRRQQNDPNL